MQATVPVERLESDDWLVRSFEVLDHVEAVMVARLLAGHASFLRRLAVLFDRLGNGWFYALFVPALMVWGGPARWRFVTVAALSLALSFTIYPALKRRLRRIRPCHADPQLDSGVAPLDLDSCPSGHTMTATAFHLPLVVAFPVLLPAAAVIWTLIAWSRLSLGHHYPTDVILGACVGAAIALQLTAMIL